MCAYKRHNFFLFKKYILHVLVISGTRSRKQIYIRDDPTTLKSFIPSLSWAYLFFNIDFFVLNCSENLRYRFCWSWIICECRYKIWYTEYRKFSVSISLLLPGNTRSTHSSILSEMSVRNKLVMFFHQLLKYPPTIIWLWNVVNWGLKEVNPIQGLKKVNLLQSKIYTPRIKQLFSNISV